MMEQEPGNGGCLARVAYVPKGWTAHPPPALRLRPVVKASTISAAGTRWSGRRTSPRPVAREETQSVSQLVRELPSARVA